MYLLIIINAEYTIHKKHAEYTISQDKLWGERLISIIHIVVSQWAYSEGDRPLSAGESGLFPGGNMPLSVP